MVAPPRLLPRHAHPLLSLSSPLPASPLSPSRLASSLTGGFFFSRRRFRCPCSTVGGRPPAWESYAERGRPRKAGGGAGAWEGVEEGEGRGRRWRAKRRWWSDETYDDESDDDDDFDLLDDDFEQPWEKIWIFKQSSRRCYLQLDQRLFSWPWPCHSGSQHCHLQSTNCGEMQAEREDPGPRQRRSHLLGLLVTSEGKKKKKRLVADAAASDREVKSPAFGGWDELDRRKEYAEGPARQQPSKKASASSSRRPPIREGKLSRSRRERNKEVPLFLRLLIAVFPFLGSWTRIL